jgi:hypothetical protein
MHKEQIAFIDPVVGHDAILIGQVTFELAGEPCYYSE